MVHGESGSWRAGGAAGEFVFTLVITGCTLVLCVNELLGRPFRFDIPAASILVWASVTVALVISVVRPTKRQQSLRAPEIKEVGRDERK
jgi:hypothetical protein